MMAARSGRSCSSAIASALRQEGDPLLRMPSGFCDERLGVEGARQRFGQSERLGDVERELGPLARPLEVARKRVPARETGRQQREVLVGLVVEMTAKARSMRSSAWSSRPELDSTSASLLETRAAAWVSPSAS